jgi:hypothetical protein
MKLTKFSQMKKRDDSMMLFVNDDLLDDLDEGSEDLISEVFRDLEIEQEWILIYEIYFEGSLDDDLDDDEAKFVNEKTSKKLLRSVLKIHTFDVRRKLVIQE